jgi:hypothetical protein
MVAILQKRDGKNANRVDSWLQGETPLDERDSKLQLGPIPSIGGAGRETHVFEVKTRLDPDATWAVINVGRLHASTGIYNGDADQNAPGLTRPEEFSLRSVLQREK